MRQLFGPQTEFETAARQRQIKTARGALPAQIEKSVKRQPSIMSTMKLKFTGLLRGLLRRFDGDLKEPQNMRALASAAPTDSSHAAQHASVENNFVSAGASANQDEIQLALQPILTSLPMELRAKIMAANTAGMTIPIPIEKALSQLATGAVKISFGELRKLAPGVFAVSGGEHDAKLVTLPLSQILAQINPALLARRSAQKQVEVADEISSPFNGRGEGLKISSEPPKPATARPPISRLASPISEQPIQPPAFAQRSITPASANPQISLQNGNNGNGSNGNGAHKPAAFDSPATAFNAAPQIPIEQSVLAPLAALAESWPETLQAEITQLNLTGAQVALPTNLIEPALKRGRVIFSWRYVRSWIKPTPPPVSVHDGIELELPLKVLAPLLFSRQNNSLGQRKVSVPEEIPNLFFGFPQAQSETPAPVAAPVIEPFRPAPKPVEIKLPDTNFYVWDENGHAPKVDTSEYKRPPAQPATDFSRRHATPQEVVARAMALPGVAGALIALPDGLKVASQIPADLNSDTLAGFLPQIFDRVNQSTKELRMGALNNLHFTVGNVPWKIFRVHAVYFAAFGHAGQSLPTAQLAALAGELDRKKQQQ
jgi:hypothetical protein